MGARTACLSSSVEAPGTGCEFACLLEMTLDDIAICRGLIPKSRLFVMKIWLGECLGDLASIEKMDCNLRITEQGAT